MIYSSILDLVGETPLVRFQLGDCVAVEPYIKLEGFNPTGSLKDRAAKWILQDKIATGALCKGMTILDASSGSYACSLALFSTILGFPLTITTGGKLTEDKARFIDYFGAKRISVGDLTIEGNNYCRELDKKHPGKYCFFDQLHNWQNFEAHYQSTGPEILRDLPDLKAIAITVGSGGTSVGTAKYLKEQNPDIKIIAVTASSGTKIPGTGGFVDGDYVTPLIQLAHDEHLYDYTAEVSDEEAKEQTLDLKKQGFYVGLQSGAALAGLIKGIKNLDITGKVALISGDAGWKGTDSLPRV